MLMVACLTSAPALLFGQTEWIPWQGVSPGNAVSGGQENGGPLPVCRADYEGAKHPGKVVAGNCNIGFGGKEVVLESFEVLVNNGGVELVWEAPQGTRIPRGAVQGGTENGHALIVGQITRPDGSVHPGKVFRTDDGILHFNYGYGGEEISISTGYRILVGKFN